MKKLIILILFFFIVSCNKKTDYGKPNITLKEIEKDYIKWWIYYNETIKLSNDFKAIDNSSNLISKDEFLRKLTSGDFIPLKLSSKKNITYYKLFKLNKDSDQGIRKTIVQVSTKIYKHFKMEGQDFPDFSFIDLNGIEYNNDNTRGKIIILKCWFINCKPCIAEFPQLNRLVSQNKTNKNLIFISLAFDTKEKLKQFLVNKPFEYTVIPNQKIFMESTLNISSYPTHFIIDKKGKIKKVINTVDELRLALGGYLNVKLKRPPPPPPPSK